MTPILAQGNRIFLFGSAKKTDSARADALSHPQAARGFFCFLLSGYSYFPTFSVSIAKKQGYHENHSYNELKYGVKEVKVYVEKGDECYPKYEVMPEFIFHTGTLSHYFLKVKYISFLNFVDWVGSITRGRGRLFRVAKDWPTSAYSPCPYSFGKLSTHLCSGVSSVSISVPELWITFFFV